MNYINYNYIIIIIIIYELYLLKQKYSETTIMQFLN